VSDDDLEERRRKAWAATHARHLEAQRRRRVDVTKLNALGTTKKGKVVFDEASVEDLFGWVEDWDHEVRVVYPPEKERYLAWKGLRDHAAALGSKYQPAGFVDWGGDDFPVRKWDRYLLGLLASNIEEVWRKCGGKTKPGKHGGWLDLRLSPDKGGEWGGPVTELMLELMKQIGVPAKRRPSRSAIRDAMKAFRDAMKAPKEEEPRP
jgi:hypothetical protein